MANPPFKHLTAAQVREYLRGSETGGNPLAVLDTLSRDARDELEGLGLYGKSHSGMDYQWHLDHITKGGYHTEWSNVDVRRGMEKLGLASEIPSE